MRLCSPPQSIRWPRHEWTGLSHTCRPSIWSITIQNIRSPAILQQGPNGPELLGNTFFIAAHYRNAAYEDARDDVGPAIGAYGQRIDAPRPLSDPWWSRNLGPLIMGAAQASADHPGLKGLVLDLELYGAGALTYGDGYAFDEESWVLITDALRTRDELGIEDATDLP